MDGPGRRTREPVPKEITGKGEGAVESRRWASIERFWFDAHTVQNFSLNESDDCVGADASAACASPVPVVDVSGGGGGGGGGGLGVAVPALDSRGS